MLNTFLAAPLAGPIVQPEPVRQPSLKVILQSVDGAVSLPLDGSTGWWRMPGSTGLEMPPVDVITSQVPGVHGSVFGDVRVQERRIGIPVFTATTGDRIEHLAMLNTLRDLVDPLTGEFLIIGQGATSIRELRCYYTGGLEGADGRTEAGIYWRKLGITAVACEPFAYDRVDRVVTFETSAAGVAFLGAAGGTDLPWPRQITSSAVIGTGMQIVVGSEVPVYPTLELVGPMTSFQGDMSTGWSVSVPGGVAAGSTLKIVTDPRSRSIRRDGALAAGSVARGSTLRPFEPGVNVLDVTAPGGTSATRIRLSWREAHRSLW